ncbi:MAG: histidine--tRNA ligase [Candidatus Omnitrophica bacterium]|nr:histidine--tRNA ligase [Candidatus Omnitrophota bacterium]
MGKHYEHVKGTVDFYPPQSSLFQNIVKEARNLFILYGYEEIILPILETEAVFAKGVGSTSDIVEKQIFRIQDKDIVLRPEGTAQVVRSYIENSCSKQSDVHKFFYIGPMFRGERPQKGRLRQFHHIGAEVFGVENPALDGEVIALAYMVLQKSGIKNITLKLNTLGCAQDKEKFSARLQKDLQAHHAKLCELCQKRVSVNPLRVLDCKDPSCKKIVASLSLGKGHLCDECQDHFHKVTETLKALSVPFEYDPFLVRGLDYYTNTVFEFISSALGAQDACGAGGRYNNLVKNLGGPDVPAIGFALGVERMLLLREDFKSPPVVNVFVAYTGETLASEARTLVYELRRQGVSADMSYKPKSLKSQLRVAQRLGAVCTVIFGEEERKEGCLTLRNMRESTQQKIAVEDIIPALKNKI